jgi:pyruvate,orthophosphate dikinase
MTDRATFIYPFSFGDKSQSDLLGGKGANLAEMVKIGLPVPPGFTITTHACREFLKTGALPQKLIEELELAIHELESSLGRTFGDPKNPLIVSVRSGAKFSMPGMMETILNVGMTPDVAVGLAEQTANPGFAWDSYRRFIDLYGRIVCGIPKDSFAEIDSKYLRAEKVQRIDKIDFEQTKLLVTDYISLIEKYEAKQFSSDPRDHLLRSIEAVFHSWNSERAQLYRQRERIPSDLGTAINIQSMVFGNLTDESGTGVAFTRNPSTGETGNYGDYLERAQGEDVVAGIRTPISLREFEQKYPSVYAELDSTMSLLEDHYRDLCDIE